MKSAISILSVLAIASGSMMVTATASGDTQELRREAMGYASDEWADTLNPACPTNYTTSCVSSGFRTLDRTCPL